MISQVHFSPSGGCICRGAYVRDGWTMIDTPENWVFFYPRWKCAICGAEHVEKYDPDTGDHGYMIGPENERVVMGVKA